jgi:hypothetical protein
VTLFGALGFTALLFGEEVLQVYIGVLHPS